MLDRSTTFLEQTAIVRRLVTDLVHDVDLRDDAAQDTMTAALRSPPREASSFRAWADTVLRRWSSRARLNAERRKRRELAAHTETRDFTDPAALAAQRELLKRVVDAVYELEEPYRQTLLLRYFEDLPPKEIGRRTHTPLETVKTRLKRGLDRVRARLDSDHRSRAAWLLPLTRFAIPIAKQTLFVRVAASILIATLGALTIVALDEPKTGTIAAVTRSPSVVGPAIADEESPSSVDRDVVATAPNSPPPIAGRIVDELGSPIPLAVVRLFDGSERIDGRRPPHPSIETTADLEGRFSTPARVGAAFVIALGAQGFASRTLPIAGSGDAGDFVLRRGFALHGVVRDLERNPVAGATVKYRVAHYVVEEELVAQSDANGEYRIEGASDPYLDDPAGEHAILLWAEHPDFAPVFQPFTGLFGFDTAGNLPIDIWLPRGATIEGRVLDAETGEGIGGAEVALLGSGSHNLVVDDRLVETSFWRVPLGVATSDASGCYALSRVPSFAVHRIGHHSPAEGERVLGYLSFRCDSALHVGPNQEILVPDESATVRYDLLALPRGFVRGRVVDASRRPIANFEVGAAVEAIADEASALSVPRTSASGTSDREGFFEIALPLRRLVASKVLVHANALGKTSIERTIDDLRAGRTIDLGELVVTDLDLGPPLCSVVVVDEREHPVANARLEMFEASRGTETQGPDLCSARTDATGRAVIFRSPHSPPEFEQARLRVEALGFEPAYSPLFRRDPPASEPIVMRFVMKRSPPRVLAVRKPEPENGARIRIMLVDALSAQPILHPRSLRLTNERGDERWFRPIEPGGYEFADVPAGSWRLYARVDGYAAHEPLTLVAPAEGEVTHTLALNRGLTVRGVVRATDGSSLAGSSLLLSPIGNGRHAQSKLGADAAFEFTSFRPGERYRAEVYGKTGGFFVSPTHSALTVANHDLLDVTLEVVPAGYAFVTSLNPRLGMPRGTATNEDGANDVTQRSFVVVLDSLGTEIARRRCVRSTGMPVFLPFGAYSFRLEVPGEAPLEQRVELSSAERTDVIFPER